MKERSSVDIEINAQFRLIRAQSQPENSQPRTVSVGKRPALLSSIIMTSAAPVLCKDIIYISRPDCQLQFSNLVIIHIQFNPLLNRVFYYKSLLHFAKLSFSISTDYVSLLFAMLQEFILHITELPFLLFGRLYKKRGPNHSSVFQSFFAIRSYFVSFCIHVLYYFYCN